MSMDQGNVATAAGADLNTAARDYAKSQGWTMPDGSYPIRPLNMHGADDLENAIRAVGRGGDAANAIRKHIMARAKALGLQAKIPDTWGMDGSLARSAEEQAGSFYRTFEPDIEVRSGGDGRTLIGYAVPFDKVQEINRNLTEGFDRSAFDHQLAAMHRVGYYHGHRNQNGVHVGHIIRAEAQPAGLYTESLISKTPAGDNLLEMVKDGSVPHQSVGFQVFPGGTQMRSGVAWRTKAHLTELAAVPTGAYGDEASISAVRAVDGICPTCGHSEGPHARSFDRRDSAARALAAISPIVLK